MCRQWRFQHSGSTRAFDYALYCRTQACMLCMFVLPLTSLIKVVNSGSFHWALSVFIYFRFMLAFRVQFAGDVIKKYRSQQWLSRIRSLALYSGLSSSVRRKFSWGGFGSRSYGGYLFSVWTVCDVTIWRHFHVSKPTFWRSLLT